MNAPPNEKAAADDHAHVRELLPWYANGTLSLEEGREVERHLAACTQCRSEIERCRLLAASVKTTDEDAWVASPAHFARVMAYIDRVESTSAVASEKPLSFPIRVREWFFGTPRPMQWAFAVQGALIVAMTVAL